MSTATPFSMTEETSRAPSPLLRPARCEDFSVPPDHPSYSAPGTPALRIFNADSFELIETWPEEVVFDHLITDPPYSGVTHDGARSARLETALLGEKAFRPISIERLNLMMEMLALRVRRWAVFTCDYRHALAMAVKPPWGWRFVRMGVWVKPGSAPQFTGDRPAQGWEAVAIMHRDVKGRMKWNGGGKPAVYIHRIARGHHPTEKPMGLLREWVSQFTNKGESILDPFAGSGTTLLAANQMGRSAWGIELDKEHYAAAGRRLELGHGQR